MECQNHMPEMDEDGDSVCLVCREVITVGALGVNGIVSSGERIGYISPFAAMVEIYGEADVVATQRLVYPELASKPRLGRQPTLERGRSNGRRHARVRVSPTGAG